jgi:carbonic anhydrase
MTATVIDTNELIRRNAEFAGGCFPAGLTIRPGASRRVVGCVGPRTDPSHVRGLKLGEATVIRNARVFVSGLICDVATGVIETDLPSARVEP